MRAGDTVTIVSYPDRPGGRPGAGQVLGEAERPWDPALLTAGAAPPAVANLILSGFISLEKTDSG